MKKIVRNSALYILFFMNFLMSLKTEFGWLFYVSAVLTVIVAFMDIADWRKQGRK